jgi:hypothetical protein
MITVVKMRHIFRNSLMRARSIKAPQEKTHCVYSVSREWSRSYVGETGSSWAERQREHKQNLEERNLERSRLAQISLE